MKIKQDFAKTSSCYKADKRIVPKGLMLHSVGCNQPDPKVFARIWKTSTNVCAHAVLGADGTVIQTLPWNHRGWHGGGSSNNTHIGVEMCEPSTIAYTSGAKFTDKNPAKTREYVLGTYRTAVELFAFLCEKYGFDPLADGVIVSHSEGYKRGIASGHADVEHLWSRFGLTMDQFRKDVKSAMTKPDKKPLYRVRTTWDNVKSQLGAYSSLDSAKKACKAGYKVFDEEGKVVYTPDFERTLDEAFKRIEALEDKVSKL